VIAAVNGAAVGWGMELALLADLRVASERARFGELFVLRGLCCDVAGPARLASGVGRGKAAEPLLPGGMNDAAEAPRLGPGPPRGDELDEVLIVGHLHYRSADRVHALLNARHRRFGWAHSRVLLRPGLSGGVPVAPISGSTT